ncbi:ORC-CDC6 family AAA ATPase, partial [Sphingobacterium multivorum]
MIGELDNPFSVTKATEFSDVEINEYWVNFNTKDNISINSILNPSEFLPKYIIGGKGCGKTHILRYFSYPLQKIRNVDIHSLLNSEKYLGLYSVFHGLNSSRFNGKGIDDNQWCSIFEYYFELYICDNLLTCIKDVMSELGLTSKVEKTLVNKIISIFSNTEELSSCHNFDSLVDFISVLRRKIDFQVLNAAFTRKLDYEEVSILFSPGDLLFGIPKIISENHGSFEGVKFIYIFDEYEKLFEWQKRFINTLVWDKKNPVTFWIGARKYGFTTRETKSGQEMKSGSEFQDVNLDTLIRNNEDLYKDFAEKLCTDRLVKYYKNRKLEEPTIEISRKFHEKFEKYDENKILNEIKEKNTKKEYEHLREFRKKLNSAIKSNYALEIRNPKQIEDIVNSITESTEDNPLYQKYKLFYFYKLWNKAKPGDSIKKYLQEINKEF